MHYYVIQQGRQWPCPPRVREGVGAVLDDLTPSWAVALWLATDSLPKYLTYLQGLSKGSYLKAPSHHIFP